MMMGGGGLLMMLLWIVIVGIVIYGIVLLIMKPFERKGNKNEQEDRALDVLRERFARGEIDETEYEEKKRVLLKG
ncbi:hypothetical protein B0X71_09295 [Planococcus lenghuensis]|uniref:SHOCT domain-containing protein n=2 Tax=Planococcus lenghuensis TaxID=2213202 RepID=A0A1Q2KYS7_9BACL|nr:hypothetical protein B0X71_09295 [Planococcus lenghuensis]